LDDINAAFVYGLTCDNVVGDFRVSHHLFNNLKWFENTWPFDEPYRASNTNGPVTYDTEGIIIISFLSLGRAIVQGRLQVVYTSSAPINLVSTGQLRKDSIEYDINKECFVVKV